MFAEVILTPFWTTPLVPPLPPASWTPLYSSFSSELVGCTAILPGLRRHDHGKDLPIADDDILMPRVLKNAILQHAN